MTGIYKIGTMFKILNCLVFITIVNHIAAQSQLPAKAAFTQDKTEGCLPLVVNFDNTSTGNVAAYHWDFGNGNISALKSPGAVYTKAGKYSVVLVVTDVKGGKDTLKKEMLIKAYDNPVTGFRVSEKGGCENEDCHFFDTSKKAEGKIVKWHWNFGDGAVDSVQHPTHKFTKAGSYNISLIVVDANSCKSYVNKKALIKITPKAQVSFSADNSGGCKVPLKVNFSNTSSINNNVQYTYKWKFGANDSSVLENPSFIYTKMGQYDVELSVTDDNNCTSTYQAKKYISLGKTKADFKLKQTTGCIPFTPEIEDLSTGVPSTATYLWVFSNGDSITGKQPQQVFTKAGKYNVTLSISSPSGCADIKTIKNAFTVLPSPVATFSHNNPVSCTVPHQVNYAPALKNSKAWEWDFGDGEKSTLKNPNKVYKYAGVYSVTLTITDNNGCTDSFTKKDLVKVNTQKAKFFPSEVKGCVPLKVDFTNQSHAFFGITQYHWDFGNGVTSNKQHPDITYNKAGTYYPKLVISDKNGCSDTVQFDSIPVGEKTNPDFFTADRKGCINDLRKILFQNLTDTIKEQVDSFYWDFISLNSKESNPIIDYLLVPGTHDVSLTSYSNGCASTLTKKDYMTVFMPSAHGAIVEDPCELDTVEFINLSTGGHIFEWTLNDEEIAWQKSFKKYLAPGAYNLSIYVKDTVTGCDDSKEFSFVIHKPLEPGFTVSADSVCANTSFLIQDTTKGALTSSWLLGNGVMATGKTLTPSYYNPGEYDITLEVTDYLGCTRSITKTNSVKILGPDFTPIITPNEGCFPLDAKLTKTGHSPYGIEEIVWGEGNKRVKSLADTIPYQFNTQTASMHTDGARVYLSVTDTIGCTVTKSTSVKLSKPVAAITYNTQLECTQTKVNFFHNNNASQNVGVLEFDWKLGENKQFNGENNTATFTSNGKQLLKLVVIDKDLGCVDSAKTEVSVPLKKLKADFIINETETTCPPLISTFGDASTVENTAIASVVWNFGDGAASQLPRPIKNYFYPGNYDISYKITDVDGCEDSIIVKSQIKVGGPTGEYELDKDSGCVPFDVTFTSKSKNAKLVNWDFGNGQLGNGYNTTTQYTIPSTYTPTFVVEDSFGCKVVYPVSPIVGLASPKPDFTVDGKCLYDEFTFQNSSVELSNNNGNASTQYEWAINGVAYTTTENTTHSFEVAGKHSVTLKATLNNSCTASTTKEIDIKALKANYDAFDNPLCRNSYLTLSDKSIAEAGLKSWQWDLGDGRKDSVQNPHYYYPVPGDYPIELIVEDQVGCFDTLKNGEVIEVFDTITPPTPLAHRVTVKENNTVHLEFSPYISRDFDSYVVFKSAENGTFKLLKTIYNPTDTIVVDSDVNTFKQSYSYKVYSQTKCGKLSKAGESEVHTSILLQTEVDTNQVNVFWSPYKGWDNIDSYILYRKSPQDNNLAKIAKVSPTTHEFLDTNVICGYPYQYVIVAEQSGGNLYSRSNLANAKPYHKSTVQPAYLVRATVEKDKHVLVEFAKPNIVKAPIASYHIEKSIDGAHYREIFSTTECCVPFEDFSTNVHSQSYYYRVRTTDICGDKSIASNIGKTVLLKAETNAEDNVDVVWTNYKKWDEGVKEYQIEQLGRAGVFEYVYTNNLTDTTFVDESNLFNQIEKVCYRVKAISNTGTVSYSNTDCTKGRSTLFVPNAFTPNGDGHNNVFKIVGAYIKEYEINIYNRYGEKIFTSYSLEDSWDGMYKSETAQEGAYLYVINAEGIDHKTHNYSGTVTLLR